MHLSRAFPSRIWTTLQLAALIFPITTVLPRAFAAPVTYTLTGYAQVNGGGQQVNTSFTWTVTADTSSITNPAPGRFQAPAASNSITFTSAGTTSIANVTVSLNTATGQVTFGSSSGGLGLTSTQLQNWDLASPIGPLTGTNFLVAGTIVTADSGTPITLIGVANTGNGPSPTFQAALPPPTISNVSNAASNILPGLPNAGIAQGAIFVLYGTGLGPANIAIAPAAFQSTTLSNTSVSVTVNGTTANAPLYYTSSNQVAALLPSNTPVGSGTVTVTYNNRTGPAAPITVVPSNVGIFTVDSSGGGAGIVTYADYSLVSPYKAANCGGPSTTCGAANPGDTLILWATGLGPVSGSDAAGAGLGKNMPDLPLTLWLGGVQAPVAYQGRSGCCIGEDQIVFTVPNNAPTGCAVPLTVQIGSQVSNSTFMPVAVGSRTCTPANSAMSKIDNTQIASPVNYANISLKRQLAPGQTYTDVASFQLLKILSYASGQGSFAVSYLDDPPPGTCMVYPSLNPKSHNGINAATAGADAGSSFNLTGPGGSKVIPGNPGQFDVTLSATGSYLSPGAYTLAGAGGVDIGSFSTAFSIPPAPVLTSPTNGALTVTRSSGMTVKWTGGDANAYVQILMTDATDPSNTNGATMVCDVAANAGTFTIPPYILLALPAGNNTGLWFQQQTEASITAKGLALGVLQTSSTPTNIPGITLK